MATYTFLEVNASIIGPGGAISIGAGAGDEEGGITIEMQEDKETMTIGADGSVMHSLHAGHPATMTVRLLKTSPVNSQLMLMYDLQRIPGGTNWGQNVILVTTTNGQDVISGRSAAFRKAPNLTYAKLGGTNEWTFNIGIVDHFLGVGYGPNIA